MRPVFLLPEQVASEDGQSTAVALHGFEGEAISLTLGITRIIEDESLDVAIWGSPDGETWQVLTTFPRKSYCGTYSMLLDLSLHKSVRLLKATWKMRRWRGERPALFGFYLQVEQAKLHAVGSG